MPPLNVEFKPVLRGIKAIYKNAYGDETDYPLGVKPNDLVTVDLFLVWVPFLFGLSQI